MAGNFNQSGCAPCCGGGGDGDTGSGTGCACNKYDIRTNNSWDVFRGVVDGFYEPFRETDYLVQLCNSMTIIPPNPYDDVPYVGCRPYMGMDIAFNDEFFGFADNYQPCASGFGSLSVVVDGVPFTIQTGFNFRYDWGSPWHRVYDGYSKPITFTASGLTATELDVIDGVPVGITSTSGDPDDFISPSCGSSFVKTGKVCEPGNTDRFSWLCPFLTTHSLVARFRFDTSVMRPPLCP
jgi:hypothetical protein